MVLLLLIINSWKTIIFLLSGGVTVTCVLTFSLLHLVYFPLAVSTLPPPLPPKLFFVYWNFSTLKLFQELYCHLFITEYTYYGKTFI
jgi:hypothetical protein